MSAGETVEVRELLAITLCYLWWGCYCPRICPFVNSDALYVVSCQACDVGTVSCGDFVGIALV